MMNLVSFDGESFVCLETETKAVVVSMKLPQELTLKDMKTRKKKNKSRNSVSNETKLESDCFLFQIHFQNPLLVEKKDQNENHVWKNLDPYTCSYCSYFSNHS